MNILDYKGKWPGEGLDLTGTITHICTCGSNMFSLVVTFDDYEIASYSLDMECVECGTRATAPTPIDHPDYEPDSLAS